MDQYDFDLHYDMVSRWFRDREMPVPRPFDFPSFGLIVPGLGAGFLIQTDTPYGIIDFLISNPLAARKKRSDAMDEITTSLMAQAKRLGFRGVKADAEILVSKERARRLGFRCLGSFDSFVKEF